MDTVLQIVGQGRRRNLLKYLTAPLVEAMVLKGPQHRIAAFRAGQCKCGTGLLPVAGGHAHHATKRIAVIAHLNATIALETGECQTISARHIEVGGQSILKCLALSGGARGSCGETVGHRGQCVECFNPCRPVDLCRRGSLEPGCGEADAK